MDAHLTLHLGLLFQAAVLRSVCHGGEVCLGVVSEEHNHNTESTVTQSTQTHVHARTHAHLTHPPAFPAKPARCIAPHRVCEQRQQKQTGLQTVHSVWETQGAGLLLEEVSSGELQGPPCRIKGLVTQHTVPCVREKRCGQAGTCGNHCFQVGEARPAQTR